MEKQLKDYLHLYLGCDLIHDTGIYKGYLSGVDHHHAVMICSYMKKDKGHVAPEGKWGEHTILIERVKPILRPLDDWSLMETSEYGIEMDSFRSIVALGIYEPKLFHYLLSKHFDLFDLIPAGLAIDHSTINQSDNEQRQ